LRYSNSVYNVLSSSVYTVQSSTVFNGASFIKSYCTLFVKLLEYGRTGLLGLCLLDLVIQKREDVVDELLLVDEHELGEPDLLNAQPVPGLNH